MTFLLIYYGTSAINCVCLRFFFYVEDDWELLDNFSMSEDMTRYFSVSNFDFHDDEIESQADGRLNYERDKLMKILEGSILIMDTNKHIDEVLLNTQWDRKCSLGYVSDCDEKFLSSGGWHRNASNGPGKTCTKSLPFSLHEFGISPATADIRQASGQYDFRRHDFSYWPGFSLNPGVWDVYRIAEKLQNECPQQKIIYGGDGLTENLMRMSPWCNFFSESDSAFEHHFSILGHLNGIHTAYLHAVIFRHIGHEVSAYKLNGCSRPWD